MTLRRGFFLNCNMFGGLFKKIFEGLSMPEPGFFYNILEGLSKPRNSIL